MKYTLVKPDGTTAQSHDFDGPPPLIAPNKGRWLPDIPPAYNPATHTLQVVAPVPADAVAIAYTVMPRPLNQVRAAKRAELKAARDAAILADVTIGTRTWPSDEEFKRKLGNIILRVSRGKPAPAKLRGTSGPAINTPTLAQLDAIDDAIAAQEDAAWDRYWLLIDAMQAAPDVVTVNAIIW